MSIAPITALLPQALAADPARPLFTYYHDGTNERVELSAQTLDNWVAKASNLLRDELDIQPEDRVAVLLPAHWHTAAILLAISNVGGVMTMDPTSATVAFATTETLDQASVARDVVGVSLSYLAPPTPIFPAAVLDYAIEVRTQPDQFYVDSPLETDLPSLDLGNQILTSHEVSELATNRATALGLSTGDRLLTTVDWESANDWLDGWLAPLAAGASVVLCCDPHEERLPARADTERVTVTMRTRQTETPEPAR